MASQTENSFREDSKLQAETELLEALLSSEEDGIIYPLNPMDLNTEAYLAAIETEFDWDDRSDVEIQEAANKLFDRFHQSWEMTARKVSLTDRLSQQFALVPLHWLEAIADRAKQIVDSNISLAEQLVSCVDNLLPNWSPDDLYVFARPVAYAMRDEEIRPATLARPWEELSEVEQARLSMTIARFAIEELKDR